jgi:hypothetical protein
LEKQEVALDPRKTGSPPTIEGIKNLGSRVLTANGLQPGNTNGSRLNHPEAMFTGLGRKGVWMPLAFRQRGYGISAADRPLQTTKSRLPRGTRVVAAVEKCR